MVIIKSRAPTRIGIAGGGTDLPQFYEQHGGAVLNVGINLYSYVTLSDIPRSNTEIISYDWGFKRNITNLDFEFNKNTTNNVDLVKASMKYSKLNPKDGYRVVISSDAPKNSGLAGSSALVTALLGAMQNRAGKSLMNRDYMALKSYIVEREMLNKAGGHQDQIAAVFGGFNFIEFTKNTRRINPLRLESDLLCELHSSMLLFETPCNRKSTASEVEVNKISHLDDKKGEMIESLLIIKNQAYCAKEALLNGDMKAMGLFLDIAWHEKRKLTGVSNKHIDKLYKTAKDAGAYGGKLCGAGGGGSMFFMCDLSDRKKVIQAMEKEGCKNVNFDFDEKGLVSWRVD